MRYLAHPPIPALRAHVEYLWTLSDTPGHARERIVPSGTIELVINLQEDAFGIHDPFTRTERTFRGAIASGCYERAFEIDTRAHALVMGVHFKPGGAARLLGVPPGALANAHADLHDLWGRQAGELRDRLCAASTPRQRSDLLEHALLARLQDRGHRRAAVSAALAELDQPRIAVGQICRALGLSRRRFIEIFSEDVGMSPKRYSMVRRFQRALAIAQHTPSPAWSRIALACGYYDQPHLCRDWVELAGVPPAEFIGLRGIPVKENHLAVPGAGSNPSNTRPRRGDTLR
jgi:AraC-like DNA-binding protein